MGVSIQQNEVTNPSNPNVHSIEEFNALNKTIESLVVASGSCSDDSITELKMNQFTQLRVLNIGNECFEDCADWNKLLFERKWSLQAEGLPESEGTENRPFLFL